MNHPQIRVDQRSIVAHILLGSPRNSLHTAVAGLKLVGLMFERIGRLTANDADLTELSRYGYRTISEMAAECADYAGSGDLIDAVDCLQRTVIGHRAAKNLLLTIVEFGDADVAKLARLVVTLTTSILDDLGDD
jgi:hypothetical protein